MLRSVASLEFQRSGVGVSYGCPLWGTGQARLRLTAIIVAPEAMATAAAIARAMIDAPVDARSTDCWLPPAEVLLPVEPGSVAVRRHDEGVVAGDGHATLGVFADLEQVEAALRLGQIRQGLEERLHVLLGGELEERLVEFLQAFGHLRQRAQRGKQITIGVHEPFGCLFVQLRGQGAQRAVDGEQLPCGIGVIEAFRHDAAALDALDK